MQHLFSLSFGPSWECREHWHWFGL